jgi:hypothetical protein
LRTFSYSVGNWTDDVTSAPSPRWLDTHHSRATLSTTPWSRVAFVSPLLLSVVAAAAAVRAGVGITTTASIVSNCAPARTVVFKHESDAHVTLDPLGVMLPTIDMRHNAAADGAPPNDDEDDDDDDDDAPQDALPLLCVSLTQNVDGDPISSSIRPRRSSGALLVSMGANAVGEWRQ